MNRLSLNFTTRLTGAGSSYRMCAMVLTMPIQHTIATLHPPHSRLLQQRMPRTRHDDGRR